MHFRLGSLGVGAVMVGCTGTTPHATNAARALDRSADPASPGEGFASVRESDDPRACVTVPAGVRALVTERDEIRERLVNVVDDWAACLAESGVPNGRQMAFELVPGPGGVTSLRARAGDPEPCAAEPCLAAAVRDLPLPTAATNAGSARPAFVGTLTYFPMTSSKVSLDEPLRSPSAAPGCGDQSELRELDMPAPSFVQDLVRREAKSLGACYEAGRRRDPDLAGEIVTELTIDPDGRVVRAEIRDNTLPDCEVVACVRTHFEHLAFPWRGAQTLTTAVSTRFEAADDPLPAPARQRELPSRGPEFQPRVAPVDGPRDGFAQQPFWGSPREGG